MSQLVVIFLLIFVPLVTVFALLTFITFIIEKISGKRKKQQISENTKRYPCPCCGFYTLDLEPPGTFDICPVCFWEDDPIQYDDPTYKGGANDISLLEARQNFKQFGAMDLLYVKRVRQTHQDELPEFNN